MNGILQSFLCGAAFIGGGVAVVCLVALAMSLKDSKARQELKEFWMASLSKQERQVAALNLIATSLSMKASRMELPDERKG